MQQIWSQKTIVCLIVLLCAITQAQAKSILTATESLQILRCQALEERLRGQDETALDIYARAIDLAKHEFGESSTYVADLYFEIGTYALEKDKFERAEDYLSKAVKINPNAITARIKLAELLRRRERPVDALQEAKQALLKDPRSLEARQLLALCYVDLSDNSRANLEFYNLDKVLHGKATPMPEKSPTMSQPINAPSTAVLIPKITSDSKKEKVAKQKNEKKEKNLPKQEVKASAKVKKKSSESEKPIFNKEPTKPIKPKPEPMAISNPPELKAKVKTMRPKNGFIPPPPPTVPVLVPPPPPGALPPAVGLTTGNPNFQLKTKVQIKQKNEPREEKSPGQTQASPAAASDDDFLLEWADKGNKKKK